MFCVEGKLGASIQVVRCGFFCFKRVCWHACGALFVLRTVRRKNGPRQTVGAISRINRNVGILGHELPNHLSMGVSCAPLSPLSPPLNPATGLP